MPATEPPRQVPAPTDPVAGQAQLVIALIWNHPTPIPTPIPTPAPIHAPFKQASRLLLSQGGQHSGPLD